MISPTPNPAGKGTSQGERVPHGSRLRETSFATLLFLLLPSGALLSQEVNGTLRRGESALAAQGTLVVAEQLIDGKLVARAVTNDRGAYLLRIGTARVVLRALRVGQEPQILDTLQLAAGERREVSRTLPDAPIRVAAFQTETDTRCRLRPDGASTVAQLFQQARTALLASQTVAPEGTTRTHARVTHSVGSAVVQREEFVSESLRAFRGHSLDTLMRAGFLTTNPDGSLVYRAPEVGVFVDDVFLANYCLHLERDADAHRGLIGVGFKPARLQRGRVEIEGTLWLDSSTSALRQLTFTYAGAEAAVQQANAGGHLDFTQLENGLWFVHRWELRMPRMGEALAMRRRDARAVRLRGVSEVLVARGEVLESVQDDALRYTVGATETLVSGGRLAQAAPDPLRDGTPCESDAQGLAYGLVISRADTIDAALPDVAVTFEWASESPSDPPIVSRVVRSDARGGFRLCGVPRDRLVTVRATYGGHAATTLQLRITSERGRSQFDVVLPRLGGS